LSRQIRALERELGLRLLQRAAHGVRATAAGDVFYEEARAILGRVDDVLSQARGVLRGIVGRCRIGAVPSELMGDLLVTALRRVNARFPEIAVEVREIVSTLHIPSLREKQIDLALAGAYPGLVDDPMIASMQLSTDVVDCALISISHPLAGRASIKPAELASEPFLFVSRSVLPKMYDTLMESFARIGLSPRMNEPVEGTRAIWRLAADGMGWTVGTRSLREKPLPGLVAIPIEGLEVPSGIVLLWRRGESSPTVQAVLEAFRGQA
jgi:DNA-binding transcriptional LysR family regulator